VTLHADPEPLYWAGDPDCRNGSVTMTGSRHCVAVYDTEYQMEGLVISLDSGGTSLLTNARDGVLFDGDGDGRPEKVSWPARGANVGMLALDLNGNGTIDNGAELFAVPASGAIRGRPPLPTENAFARLAAYDLAAEGGDGDGAITPADGVYARLRVWVDRNHDPPTPARQIGRLREASP
jgi:hypothetical protein